MMSKYHATLTKRKQGEFSPQFHQNIEADNIIELLNKFYLASIQLIKQEHDEEINHIKWEHHKEDDIPF